ncbi:MAG TPA: hypothetical protein VHH91_14365 [Vicinamibacterales bacterium]|nr:hypothetical protein [Vicinamibacterales bacterium]
MLQPHDQVPHFVVTDVGGRTVTYAAIWQHAHLVLVSLGNAEAPDERLHLYVDKIRAWAADDLACVVTRDAVPGLPSPGAIVADRWGEIVHVTRVEPRSLPSAENLGEWVAYLRIQCPECEGEAR